MILFWQRFQDHVVKLFLYGAAFASVLVDRLWPGADVAQLIEAEVDPSPQDMLVRLTTVMIAGSLSMLALGYSTPARTVPVQVFDLGSRRS
jgi:hypothetical protein